MKRALILFLSTVLALAPLLARAELTGFEPAQVKAADAKTLLETPEGRETLAALLLADCLAGEAVPEAACLPDRETVCLLSTGTTLCLLLSAGERTLALYYGLEAQNAGWDAVESPLTEGLIVRLTESLKAERWTLDPSGLFPAEEA